MSDTHTLQNAPKHNSSTCQLHLWLLMSALVTTSMSDSVASRRTHHRARSFACGLALMTSTHGMPLPLPKKQATKETSVLECQGYV
jgi:hypothetical protein